AAARHADRDRPSLQRVAAGRAHGRRPTPRPGCGRRGGRAAGAGAHRQGAAHARRRQAAARDAGVRQPCRLRRAACSMTLLRSSLFALALIIVTPPYAVLALATFPLPRLLRYRIISGWSRLVVLLARVILGIRWRVEGREHPVGGAWLAVASGAPIVPVAHNAGLLWPRNAFVKRPGVVTVRIGPSIDTRNRDAQTVNSLAESWIEEQQRTLCPGS